MAGFVKLNRDLLEWAWSDNAVTFGVYAKFLLLAAWKEIEYHGVRLKRGELLTNQSEIAQQTGLSRQQVRTVLDRLKATNKITIKQSGRNSIITMLDYDCETDFNQIDNRFSTTCQPDSNQTSLLKEEYKEDEEPKNARSREGGELSESFEKFWSVYPKKTAKKDAFKAWQKLKPDEELLNNILSSLEQQKKSVQWTKEEGQYIPYPATWLNGRRWEDDVTQYQQQKARADNGKSGATAARGFAPSSGFVPTSNVNRWWEEDDTCTGEDKK